MSAVIGRTFGGNHLNFNVPDLINKALYGVNNSPASSTLYRVSSGTNCALSATGALYIIKAKPDGVLNVTMSVSSPLCAAVNRVQQNGSYFNPLSGTIDIGLRTTSLTGDTTILGGFVADRFGRVLRTVDDPAPPPFDPGPGTRPTYNGGVSPIAFFRTPAYILYQPYTNATTNLKFTMSAYPFITDNTGTRVGSPNFYSVPPTAKNLIVDTSMYKRGPDTGFLPRIIAAAPNISQLEDVNDMTLGLNEMLVNVSTAAGAGDSIQGSCQCLLPLSANSLGHLTAAFRVSTSSRDSYWVRVVGYTL